MEQEHKISRIKSFDGGAFAALFFGAVLLPIFFLPMFNLPLDVTKSAFYFALVLVALLVWLIARMKDGRIVFPKSILLLATMVLPVAFLVSALFSDVPLASLIGVEYEAGTFFSIFVLAVSAFLATVYFQKKERAFSFYTWLTGASFVSFLFLIIGFLVAWGLLPQAISSYIAPNLVGKWNDLAAFFGLTGVLALLALELVPLEKKIKIGALVSLGLSVLVLALVNFSLLWIIVGVFSFLVFVYGLSFGQKHQHEKLGNRKMPTYSLGVLLLSVFFVLANVPIGNFLRGTLRVNIPQEVLRPSWPTTTAVANEVLKKDPIFGVGPNRFISAWSSYKPSAVNSTDAWGVDFSNGIGVIPTFGITLGSLGVLAWLAFFGCLIYCWVKTMKKTSLNRESLYFLASSFMGAAYLWAVAIFYVPNIVLFALAFFMTGMFIAALVEAGVEENYNFSFTDDPRIGFASVLVLTVLIVLSLVGGYFVVEKFVALKSFQQGSNRANAGDILGARKDFENARNLRANDLFYRILSDADVQSLSAVLNQTGLSQETLKAQFQQISRDAIENALNATKYDGTNYANWIALAHSYQAMIPYGAGPEFYESAKKSYVEARTRNPVNPGIALEEARLELLNKNKLGAKEHLAEALTLKSDYVEAIFLLAQIQADDGDLATAIASTEIASQISPNDIGAFFQLGFLRYKNSKWSGAVAAFERVLELNPSYSNAKYFLGLSYDKLGRTSDAIAQFEGIATMNPGNVEIEGILKNLRAGNSALAQPAPAKKTKK